MLVGLVPMGGFAERWRPYPCPKELLPAGMDSAGRPRVIADYIIDRMIAAGVEMVVMPVRPEKAQLVIGYFGHQLANGALIAYVAAPGPTLLANLQACVPLLRGHQVLFGFPDTFVLPTNPFNLCLELLEPQLELALGSFLNHNITRVFAVKREGYHLQEVRVTPLPLDDTTSSREVWGVAAWNPAFTERLAAWQREDGDDPSFVLNAAAQAGQARCQPMPDGEFFEDLASYKIYQRFLASGYLNNQLSGQPSSQLSSQPNGQPSGQLNQPDRQHD